LLQKRTFGNKWHKFYGLAGNIFCHENNSVSAVKEAQTIDPSQWPGVILLSSATRLLTLYAGPALQRTG